MLQYGCKNSKIKKSLCRKLNRSINRALQFSDEKHAELREKSSITMAIELKSNTHNKNLSTLDDESSISYKFLRALVWYFCKVWYYGM